MSRLLKRAHWISLKKRSPREWLWYKSFHLYHTFHPCMFKPSPFFSTSFMHVFLYSILPFYNWPSFTRILNFIHIHSSLFILSTHSNTFLFIHSTALHLTPFAQVPMPHLSKMVPCSHPSVSSLHMPLRWFNDIARTFDCCVQVSDPHVNVYRRILFFKHLFAFMATFLPFITPSCFSFYFSVVSKHCY